MPDIPSIRKALDKVIEWRNDTLKGVDQLCNHYHLPDELRANLKTQVMDYHDPRIAAINRSIDAAEKEMREPLLYCKKFEDQGVPQCKNQCTKCKKEMEI